MWNGVFIWDKKAFGRLTKQATEKIDFEKFQCSAGVAVVIPALLVLINLHCT